MDGRQHNAPNQYFATSDGAPDITDEDHATAILSTPMEADESSFSLTTYDPLTPVGHVPSQQQTRHQSQRQQQQQFAYLESGNANPHYGFNAEPGSGPSTYHTSTNWQQASQQLMYANPASVPVPVPSHGSMPSFGYETYSEGHTGENIEDTTMSHGHGHGYVAPMDTTLQMNYGYNWETQDTIGMEFEPSPLQSPTGYNSTPVSPLATGTFTGTGTAGTGTPTSYASSSSGGQYSIMYTGANLQAQAVAAAAMGDDSAYAMGGEDERESTPIPKRARTRPSLSRASRTSFQIGPSSSSMPSSSIMGEGSMSSAAGPSSSQVQAQAQAQAQAQVHRHSSHTTTTPRQAEKKEEKKTRSSHNLVEKQYRNRLNAQFEGLMNALPESLRLQGASLGVMGEGGEGMASDTPERKPSKAEVLEMARMHIRSLEQERDSLVNERDGLLGNIKRLQGILESQTSTSAEEDDVAP